jgi:hypothetical protein
MSRWRLRQMYGDHSCKLIALMYVCCFHTNYILHYINDSLVQSKEMAPFWHKSWAYLDKIMKLHSDGTETLCSYSYIGDDKEIFDQDVIDRSLFLEPYLMPQMSILYSITLRTH